ncbi:YdcF family protein [Hyphococcus sp.]|uniref:YdcF family protein n=1 Tax=Hyphococcus sp. TaxID=2038636 RepID=UPI003D14D4EE
MRRLIVVLTVTALIWAGGLVLFIGSLPRPSSAAPGLADGVAVYTGGGGVRISTAMAIFADGAGERLLISGVHPDTSAARLSDFWVGPKERYDCCVDLGREALTTEGNAGELRNWAAAHNFTSIILVTSDYHMPRAMAVTRARMPGATITPYPTASGYLDDKGRPASFNAGLKLAGEYTKFLLARVKALFPGNGR